MVFLRLVCHAEGKGVTPALSERLPAEGWFSAAPPKIVFQSSAAASGSRSIGATPGGKGGLGDDTTDDRIISPEYEMIRLTPRLYLLTPREVSGRQLR
jgi:hypothetical protein